MGKTIIITDSGCDIPENIANALSDSIKIIPYTICLTNDESYKDNQINKKCFSQNIDLGIRPIGIRLYKNDILDVLNGLDEKCDEIIFITSSGMLYPDNEVNIKEAVLEYFANHIKSRIAIIDSNTTSMALGFLVLDAARMIDMKCGFDEIVRYVKTNKSRYRMDVISNDSTILREKRIISSRQSKLMKNRKKNYLISMSCFGMLMPIMGRTDIKDIRDIMIERLADYSSYNYAIVSSSLNHDMNYFIECIGEILDVDPICSKFSCSNTTFVGTDSISLCYKKKK